MSKPQRLFREDGCDIVSLRDWLAVSATEKDIERHRPMEVNPDDGCMEYTLTREQARYAYADAMLEASK